MVGSRGGTNSVGVESTDLLFVSGLEVEIDSSAGKLRPVDGVDLEVTRGEIVGIVGESGSGKTLVAHSILRLTRPPVEIVGGEVRFDGLDVLRMDEAALRSYRGAKVGLVFQSAGSSLNPLMRVGAQIAERLVLHGGMTRRAAHERAIDLLGRVGIPSPKFRARSYPHEFSGGMAQRVMIAAAIANEPKLLIADEPTTALDATTQAQIMELLVGLSHDLGMSMILITHNLGLVAGVCSRISVMYAGRVMEEAPVDNIFSRPAHPYTRGLLEAVPRPTTVRGERLRGIDGLPPDLLTVHQGCAFFDRCRLARPDHETRRPNLVPLVGEPVHKSACWIAEEVVRLPLGAGARV